MAVAGTDIITPKGSTQLNHNYFELAYVPRFGFRVQDPPLPPHIRWDIPYAILHEALIQEKALATQTHMIDKDTVRIT